MAALLDTFAGRDLAYAVDLDDVVPPEMMTEQDVEMMIHEWMHLEPDNSLAAAFARSNSSQQSSSLSPEGSKPIYTPTSTLLDYRDDRAFEVHDDDNTAWSALTESNVPSAAADFELLSPHSSAQSYHFDMNQPNSPSRPPSSTQLSRESRDASAPAPSPTAQQSPWQSFSTATSQDHPPHYSEFQDRQYNTHAAAAAAAADATAFSPAVHPYHQPHVDLLAYGANAAQSLSNQPLYFHHAAAAAAATATTGHVQWAVPTLPSQPNLVPLILPQHHILPNSFGSNIAPIPPHLIAPHQQPSLTLHAPMNIAWTPQQPQQNPQHALRQAHHQPPAQQATPSPAVAAISTPTSQISQRPQVLLPAGRVRPSPNAARPSASTSLASSSKPRKGGRKKDSKLSDAVRQKASDRRKTGACWRCVFQRDECLGGDPCDRCMMRSQKGQAYFFTCDRSKLPDFVHDFLPASMTLMHQKQTIEDCVSREVHTWDTTRFVDVHLTSGWGHALQWRLYEFIPKSPELLQQYQYLQNPDTGAMIRWEKYSPPLGIIKIESDEAQFDRYLNDLFTHDQLQDFAQMCFASESQVETFQEHLLSLICALYTHTHDTELKELLDKILRMLVLTYIMGHTLTIVESTLSNVLQHVRHTERPQGSDAQEHTSPRLANRQLKFYFAVLRARIYDDILRWQQAILHGSAKKDKTWLPVFCVMLGFAMVLEEIQCTLQIQADAKAEKGEMSYGEAQEQARNACERIDERFELMVALFQCKFRSTKWSSRGSFGNQTPTLTEAPVLRFLTQLRNLVRTKEAHLRQRKEVPLGPEYQCQYTSRLVARFLLPFLNLPP